MVTMTQAEAQRDLGRLLDAAQMEPIRITREGQSAAYLVDERRMSDLLGEEARHKRFSVGWKTWKADAMKNPNPEAEELSESEIVKMVHESRA